MKEAYRRSSTSSGTSQRGVDDVDEHELLADVIRLFHDRQHDEYGVDRARQHYMILLFFEVAARTEDCVMPRARRLLSLPDLALAMIPSLENMGMAPNVLRALHGVLESAEPAFGYIPLEALGNVIVVVNFGVVNVPHLVLQQVGVQVPVKIRIRKEDPLLPGHKCPWCPRQVSRLTSQ